MVEDMEVMGFMLQLNTINKHLIVLLSYQNIVSNMIKIVKSCII